MATKKEKLTKTCIKCKQEFPATTEYFYKKGKYLQCHCKTCDNKIRRVNYKANFEKERLSRRARYRANPKKEIARSKVWAESNPEKIASKKRRRRAKRIGNGFEPYTLKEMFQLYGTNCYLCDMPIDLNAPRGVGQPGWRSGLHIEHFIDIARGGPDTLENVRPSHAWCNLTKAPVDKSVRLT